MSQIPPEEVPQGKTLRSETAETPPPQPEAVDAQTHATAILTKCATGGDMSGDFTALAMCTGAGEIVPNLGAALAENVSLLTEAHHWMTLSRGVGVDTYIAILRAARKDTEGINRLSIATKLVDALRRKGDASLFSEAEAILTTDMRGLDYRSRTPESCSALSSAYYVLSFLPRSNYALDAQATQEDRILYQSLSDLVTSGDWAREGRDLAGEAQAKIRFLGIQLDNGICTDIPLMIQSLQEWIDKLQDVQDTWGQRFLKNALGRRVEAAAKCKDYHWREWYDAYIALPGIVEHCGGEAALKEWQAKFCPPELKDTE